MSERQQVWKLMMFELKLIKAKNVLNFLLYTVIAILFFSWFVFSGEFEIINGNQGVAIAVDSIFFGYTIAIIMYLQSKAFKMQSLKGGLYASPFLVVLRTMPISEKVILKSRIFLFLIMAVLITTSHMLIIYFTAPELKNWITLSQLPAWLIIWNMITLSIAIWMPMGEPGSTYTMKYLITFSVIFYGLVIAGLVALVSFSGNGVLGWIIYFSSEHLIPTLIISVLVGLASIIFAYYYMNHFMKKVDYHV